MLRFLEPYLPRFLLYLLVFSGCMSYDVECHGELHNISQLEYGCCCCLLLLLVLLLSFCLFLSTTSRSEHLLLCRVF